MRYRALILLTFMLCLFSCNSQNIIPDDYQRQWMLVSYKDYSKDFLIQKNAYLDFSPTKSEAGSYRAFMGCNNLFINAAVKSNGNLKIKDLGSTEMFCGDNKDLEKHFMHDLVKMNKMQIEGHLMTLSDDAGNKMKFIAADWD